MRLDLSLIVRDPAIQPRETMNQDVITQYAEDMLAGTEFPPVVVFHDGERHWLSEGFHRIEAAEQAGFEDIEADVREGTRDDAVWFAAGANKEHDRAGQRRSNADKRRAVEMALRHPDAVQMSSTKIANHCGVSHQTVQNVRRLIFQDLKDTGERVVTRQVNGQTQTFTMQTGGIGHREPDSIPQDPVPRRCEYCGKPSPDRFRLCEDHRFTCPDCGEVFGRDEEVWHCPGCDHHWLIGDDECRNCHNYERREDGSIWQIRNGPGFVMGPEAIRARANNDPPYQLLDPPVLVYAPDPEYAESSSDGPSLDDQEESGLFVLDDSIPMKSNSRPKFNQTNEMVEWAWWTWNPVTGCEHNCVYCYARDMANRFYPEKFTPTFRPERLEAPRNTTRPEKAETEIGWRNVFVCSMADLFGRWVPDDWIESVFESCRRSPEWNYLFLTKFPLRYERLEFPETAWVGTSVDEQKRVANAEKAFAKVRAPIKWLSCEPLREPLKFTRLDLFDWVVIGGQSSSSQAPEFLPPFEWVADLVTQAKAAGCKVYIKPNIGFDGPTRPREYPGQIAAPFSPIP